MALYLNGQNISSNSGMPVELIGVDTTDATAKASDILLGKTAYVNDVKITGTSTFDADTKDATATAEDILTGKTAYVSGEKIVGVAQDNKAPYAWGKYNVSNELVTVGDYTAVEYISYANCAYFVNCEPANVLSSATIDFALNDLDASNGYLFYGSDELMSVYISDGYLIAQIEGSEVLNTPIDTNRHSLTLGLNNIILDGVEVATDTGLADLFTGGLTGISIISISGVGLPDAKYYYLSVETSEGNYEYLPCKDASEKGYFYSPNSEEGYLDNLIDPTSTATLGEEKLGPDLTEIIKGDFIEYIVDDSENTYPDGDVHTDSYWYERAEVVDTEGMYCWAKFNEEPELPTGYTKLESITTTGTQYFDSGYYINTTTSSKKLKVVADMALSAISTSLYYVSGHGGAQPLVYFGSTSTGKFGYGNGTADAATSVAADTSRHTWTLDYVNGKFTVDSLVNITFTPPALTASYNFFISAYNQQGAAKNIHGMTIYSWEFYESGELIKRLIPALDTNGVACLYDTISKQPIYAIGGTPNAGANLGKVIPNSYILSNNLNIYPQDGYHTDDFYYKLLDNEIPWEDSGRYAWTKNSVIKGEVDIQFITKSNVTLTSTTGGYTVVPSSGGWGNAYIRTDVIDTSVHKLTIEFNLGSSPNAGLFLGFADTEATNYTALDHSLYLSTGGYVCHWRNGTQVNSYGSTVANSKFVLTLYNGEMTCSLNGSVIFTDTVSFTNAYGCGIFYTSGTNYGVINAKIDNVDTPEFVNYIVGNEDGAYPNDGIADDGYWYQLVGSTKLAGIKCANGQTTSASNKITVTGLGFKPYAFAVYYGTSFNCFVFCDSSGNIIANRAIYSTSNYTATPTISDDGFTYTCTLFGSGITSINWYAVGY